MTDDTPQAEVQTSEFVATTRRSQRCSALKKDGSPCMGFATRSGLCPGHLADARVFRSMGGKASSRRARLAKRLDPRLKGILDLLDQGIRQVHAGELPASRGTALASMASAMVRVLEAGELELRLSEIEATFTIQKIGKADGGTYE